IGRDQYNIQYQQERESFLASIAATKTRASRLVVLGFLMMFVGAGVYGWALLRTLGHISSASGGFDGPSGPDDIDPIGRDFFGPPVGGVPVGLIGFGVAFVGQFILIAGIVLHIVAAARRRRINDYIPPPPQFRY